MRHARRTMVVRGKGKKTVKWCGDSVLQTILAGAVVNDVIQLCPTVGVDIASDVVHQVSHIHLHIKRLLVSALDGFAYVVWSGKVLVGTGTPVQALDPLSLDAFDWADADIMLHGALPVPPIISAGNTGVAEVDASVIPVHIEVKAKRRFSRVNHGIFMAISADVSSVMSVFIQHRTLLSYGSR